MWEKIYKLYDDAYFVSTKPSTFLITHLIENATDAEINELNDLDQNILFYAVFKNWDPSLFLSIINRMKPEILNHKDKYSYNWTVLHYAIDNKECDMTEICKLLISKMSVKSLTAKGMTIYDLAIENNKPEIAEMLKNLGE